MITFRKYEKAFRIPDIVCVGTLLTPTIKNNLLRGLFLIVGAPGFEPGVASLWVADVSQTSGDFFKNFVGVPGFEPGVACSQNRNVSRYTTPRQNF